MLITEKNRLQMDSAGVQNLTVSTTTKKTFISEYSANEIKEALLPRQELSSPLEELIATSEAVFQFIHQSELSLEMKNAFYRLQKQFDFYKNLLA